jgi:membrane fusion protein, copper/silver efflux system
VDQGQGRYEPREVALGARAAGGYEVKRGLAAGERVVVSANFLLDSESSLRAAIARASGGN